MLAIFGRAVDVFYNFNVARWFRPTTARLWPPEKFHVIAMSGKIFYSVVERPRRIILERTWSSLAGPPVSLWIAIRQGPHCLGRERQIADFGIERFEGVFDCAGDGGGS